MTAAEPRPLPTLAGLVAWIALGIAMAEFTSSEDKLKALPGLPDIAGDAYPHAPRGGAVDDYHGVAVADPWRWLEDADAPATQEWIRGQNALTDGYLSRLPRREHFASRLRALLDHERRGVPERENGVYVYPWNPGTAEQDALRVTRDRDEPGSVLVDPVAIRADGTVSLGGFELSPDGSRLAYALSDGGSDWRTWRVRDVASGEDLPEVLAGIKFSSVSWSRDGSGFYYSRYPGNGGGGWDDRRQVAVYFHAAGTPQADDRLVYEVRGHATRDPYASVTPDGRFLILHIEDGYLTNAVHYRRLDQPDAPVVQLLDAWDARYDFLGVVGDTFYVLTTKDAPRGRIIAVDLNGDLAAPESARWREVIAEDSAPIDAAALVGGRLVIQRIRDVRAELTIHALDGTLQSEVELPGAGTVTGLRGVPDDPEAFFSYTDFTTPRRVYALDVRTGKLQPFGPAPAHIDARDFVSEQVFYTSRDGQAPTVLYGYGGFNVSLLPAYSASRMAWIEAGGVYAQANLRGGGEYGEAWHLAGTKLQKQNVFDDFIAAAEWLIGNGITSSRNLAIWGGSNGGLLVGAVLNQRPDLFAAAVPAVGVMDMLRYQTASLNARKWSTDYGLSEDPEEFRALRAYSPYHNVRAGTCYPPVLVQADANDDRVSAWHSYKYAAALQDAQSATKGCSRPVLIRIETRSGHGAGASLSKTVNEYADQWAFVAAATGLRVSGR